MTRLQFDHALRIVEGAPVSRLGPADDPSPAGVKRSRVVEGFVPFGLVVLSLVIGLYNVHGTGPLWPDSPRYANAGAMIHDWLLSGQWSRPFDFASDNYARYPAFNIPYHPPACPGLLGLVFLVTGVSYTAARAVSAACLAISAVLFYRIQRGFALRPRVAGMCALLFVTTPGIAHWSRDTMSEVPSLAFALAGTAVFLSWLRQGGAWRCWLAIALALVGFFARVTTAGVLPAWFLFAIVSGRGKRLLSAHVIAPATGYVVIGAAWVLFAARFSRFEMAADGKADGLSWRNLAYFADVLPEMLLWGTVLAGLAGLVCLLGRRQRTPAGLFWMCWLVSYLGFKLAMPTTSETRHLFAALPAFAGLTGCLLAMADGARLRERLPAVAVALALAVNVYHLLEIPVGVVGYDAAARKLAALPRPGNVLLNCWQDQEVIFRYRTWPSAFERRLTRGDRTLAVRVADYARRPTEVRARVPADVLDIIERGRIRYLVTCTPAYGKPENRTPEMMLADETVRAFPDRFANLGAYPVIIQFGGRPSSGKLELWENLQDLPDTPSELPVEIPTAGMVIGSPGK